jgi:hypothetical protein
VCPLATAGVTIPCPRGKHDAVAWATRKNKPKAKAKGEEPRASEEHLKWHTCSVATFDTTLYGHRAYKHHIPVLLSEILDSGDTPLAGCCGRQRVELLVADAVAPPHLLVRLACRRRVVLQDGLRVEPRLRRQLRVVVRLNVLLLHHLMHIVSWFHAHLIGWFHARNPDGAAGVLRDETEYGMCGA